MLQMTLSCELQKDLVQKLEITERMNPKIGLKELFGREVLTMQVLGDCCWVLWPQLYYRGVFFYLYKGFTGTPTFEIQSMRKVECPTP